MIAPDRLTAKRLAEIQRTHGVRLKIAFRRQTWVCSVFHHALRRQPERGCDFYSAGTGVTLADLLDSVVHDLEDAPSLYAFVRAFFGVEVTNT